MKILLPILLATSLHAQTWYAVTTVDQQSPKVTVTMPGGTTYRIGSTTNDVWSVPITLTKTTAVVNYADGKPGHPPDPDPGFPKIMQVTVTPAVQSIVITDGRVNPSTVTTVNVPALGTPPFVGPYTCTVQFTPNWTFSIDPNTCVVKK